MPLCCFHISADVFFGFVLHDFCISVWKFPRILRLLRFRNNLQRWSASRSAFLLNPLQAWESLKTKSIMKASMCVQPASVFDHENGRR